MQYLLVNYFPISCYYIVVPIDDSFMFSVIRLLWFKKEKILSDTANMFDMLSSVIHPQTTQSGSSKHRADQ